MQPVRLIEIPSCRMVSSGRGMFGQARFERFDAWFSAQPRSVWPRDYLYSEDDKGETFVWLYLYEDGMDVPEEFEIVDFPGGLYCVTTDIDGNSDVNSINHAVDAFLDEHNLSWDPSRNWLGNVISSEAAQKALGYGQMDYYIPVLTKE